MKKFGHGAVPAKDSSVLAQHSDRIRAIGLAFWKRPGVEACRCLRTFKSQVF